MNDDRQRAREATREWVRATTGILSAFKEAMEETIQDILERGDLAPERAREAVRQTMSRAQQAVEETRVRLDFATRQEVAELRDQVDELRRRIEMLEPGGEAGGIPIDDT